MAKHRQKHSAIGRTTVPTGGALIAAVAMFVAPTPPRAMAAPTDLPGPVLFGIDTGSAGAALGIGEATESGSAAADLGSADTGRALELGSGTGGGSAAAADSGSAAAWETGSAVAGETGSALGSAETGSALGSAATGSALGSAGVGSAAIGSAAVGSALAGGAAGLALGLGLGAGTAAPNTPARPSPNQGNKGGAQPLAIPGPHQGTHARSGPGSGGTHGTHDSRPAGHYPIPAGHPETGVGGAQNSDAAVLAALGLLSLIAAGFAARHTARR